MTKKEMLIRGRFDKELNPIMAEINASITFDKAMYAQDIKQSIVHAQMLQRIGIISNDISVKIVNGLTDIQKEIESGDFAFSLGLEDIHMNIESRLRENIGDIAGFLPCARSRNDQVATDLKMWVRDSQVDIRKKLEELIRSLCCLAKNHVFTSAPGYTHLQPGQPVSFAHHLLCFCEMFLRDLQRYKSFGVLSNECPLGSAALAGTPYNIDRQYTADKLGFARPTHNSLDGVSDRDFALDHLYANSVTIIHLSRLAEEIVMWMNPQFSFIRLSDEWTTGSSIMPQKRNPDAAEIIRGKSGRIIGYLNSLLITLKGLPLTFSKDMQEDKEPVFESTKNIILCIEAMNGMINNMEVDEQMMGCASEASFAVATDIADWLVMERGYPFRTAHEITGKIVKLAESRTLNLHQLNLKECQEICPDITQELLNGLTAEKSIGRKTSFGGTSHSRVLEQLELIDIRLQEMA